MTPCRSRRLAYNFSMPITLDTATEERIQREIARGPYREPAEVISHALDLLESEEDWLLVNRDRVNKMLDESFAEAERGEGYSPEEVKAHLDEHRAKRIARAA
jgi:Arc/MetJ-type ribon-helix-helix transcriptional regulator